MKIRPEWDNYFVTQLLVVASRSTCKRRSCSAIITINNKIVASGYNGAPPGQDHCDITGCIREERNIPSGQMHEVCRAVHAEQNAIIQCAKEGIKLDEPTTTLYASNKPCFICAKMIVSSGIKRLVYVADYPDEMTDPLLKDSDLQVSVFSTKGFKPCYDESLMKEFCK